MIQGTITYKCDTLNRLSKLIQPGNIVTSYTGAKKGTVLLNENSYKKDENLKTMTYPSGRVITYNYSNDRVVSVLNNATSMASNITYRPFGGMSSITYGNGVNGTIGYDQQYRIASIVAGSIQNLTYVYDANGNITGITNTLDTSKNKTYTYDALDRLVGAVGPWGTLNYAYDGVGNRQTESTGTGVTNYAYNANKLMGSTGGKAFTFAYDNNGNTVAESRELTADRLYIYNQNQRLIKVTENGNILGEYTYDGSGLRVKKTVNGQAIIFHYDISGRLIAETDVSGSVSAEYLYLYLNVA